MILEYRKDLRINEMMDNGFIVINVEVNGVGHVMPHHILKLPVKNYKKNQTQLDMWAKSHRSDNPLQRNAQRCPKCSIYIEKIDGCDHMLCTKCNSKFCYRCGSRMRLPHYIGHDAKYSIFGCKYKLWPDQPCLRWLVRGSIFAGVLILSPVVLVILLALLAIGIPITLIIGVFALPLYCCVKCKGKS